MIMHTWMIFYMGPLRVSMMMSSSLAMGRQLEVSRPLGKCMQAQMIQCMGPLRMQLMMSKALLTQLCIMMSIFLTKPYNFVLDMNGLMLIRS